MVSNVPETELFKDCYTNISLYLSGYFVYPLCYYKVKLLYYNCSFRTSAGSDLRQLKACCDECLNIAVNLRTTPVAHRSTSTSKSKSVFPNPHQPTKRNLQIANTSPTPHQHINNTNINKRIDK